MGKLTVTIITFNEEKNIERCLRSVKKVADEIIVVDSMSTDRTKEICLSHNVVFIEQPFLGFIEQKNFALSKASNIHVLSLDADEEASEALLTSILKEKEKGFPFDGYKMNRFNNYCGKWIRHGDYYPDRKLRLLNKEKGKWGGENPHDKIIMLPGVTVERLQGDLLHYSFYTIPGHRLQMEKFSSIAANAMFRKGREISFIKPIIGSIWVFIRGYLIKMGVLDGWYGFVIAKMNSWYTYNKYRKLINLTRSKKHPVDKDLP